MMGGTVIAIPRPASTTGGPRCSESMYAEKPAIIGCWLVFVGFNTTFFTQFVLGAQGMPRRYASYVDEFQWMHISLDGRLVDAAGRLPRPPVQRSSSLAATGPKPARANPWGGMTLEWDAESPRIEHNFAPRADRQARAVRLRHHVPPHTTRAEYPLLPDDAPRGLSPGPAPRATGLFRYAIREPRMSTINPSSGRRACPNARPSRWETVRERATTGATRTTSSTPPSSACGSSSRPRSCCSRPVRAGTPSCACSPRGLRQRVALPRTGLGRHNTVVLLWSSYTIAAAIRAHPAWQPAVLAQGQPRHHARVRLPLLLHQVLLRVHPQVDRGQAPRRAVQLSLRRDPMEPLWWSLYYASTGIHASHVIIGGPHHLGPRPRAQGHGTGPRTTPWSRPSGSTGTSSTSSGSSSSPSCT